MSNLDKTMRTSEDTLKRLKYLRYELQKEHPKEYISNDFIINNLLDIKNQLSQDYVTREHYNEINSIKDNQKVRIQELEEQLENNLSDRQNSIAGFKETIQKQGKTLEDYKQDIRNKNDLIKKYNDAKNILLGQVYELEGTVKKLKQENQVIIEKNNRLNRLLSEEYFPLYSLKAMVGIIDFLGKPLNKRRFFTAQEIYKGQCFFNQDEIYQALGLARYRCFPVKVARNNEGVLFYRYNKI